MIREGGRERETGSNPSIEMREKSRSVFLG